MVLNINMIPGLEGVRLVRYQVIGWCTDIYCMVHGATKKIINWMVTKQHLAMCSYASAWLDCWNTSLYILVKSVF